MANHDLEILLQDLFQNIDNSKKIVAIASGIKGRVGKTTLAINMAYLRAKQVGNENFVLLDADSKTNSARVWASLRSQDDSLMPILIVKAEGGKDFAQQIDLYVKKGYEILIDVGADNKTEFNATLIKAQKIYIPCPISYMDTFSLSLTDNDVGTVINAGWNPNLKTFIYASMVAPNNLMVADELRDFKELVSELKYIKPIETDTKSRKAFRKSIQYGKTVFELTPDQKYDEKAVQEMLNFYKEIYGK